MTSSVPKALAALCLIALTSFRMTPAAAHPIDPASKADTRLQSEIASF
jgi:hypothetical protein